jgi:hypothetical protein
MSEVRALRTITPMIVMGGGVLLRPQERVVARGRARFTGGGEARCDLPSCFAPA